MKSKIRWQKQKAKKERNLEKILQALASKDGMGFEEIRRQTRLSRKTLNSHLDTLQKERRIFKDDAESGDNKYRLPTSESIAFISFTKIDCSFDSAEYTPLKQKVNRPKDCLDQYGLLPFDPTEQKKRAEELTRKLVDRLLFTMMKLAIYFEEGNTQKKALWVHQVLEYVPEAVQSLIEGYIHGCAYLVDNEGHRGQYYCGDDLAMQGQPYYNISDLVTQLKFPALPDYRDPKILAEANRRRRTRLRFLVEAIKKLADDENLNYLERSLESREKFAKGEIRSIEADRKSLEERFRFQKTRKTTESNQE
jgi:hypothetical protein